MVRSVTILPLLILTITLFGSVQSQQKPGKCASNLEINVCSTTCYSDRECRGSSKCCRTSCGGTLCVSPVMEEFQGPEKYGRCPSPPPGPWVCSSRCGTDSDCRGKKKCCRNRCGAMACFNPEIPNVAKAL